MKVTRERGIRGTASKFVGFLIWCGLDVRRNGKLESGRTAAQGANGPYQDVVPDFERGWQGVRGEFTGGTRSEGVGGWKRGWGVESTRGCMGELVDGRGQCGGYFLISSMAAIVARWSKQ